MDILNSVYKSLAAAGSNPQVDIQSHLDLGNNTYKVVATISSVANEDDFNAAIINMTGGTGRVIPGAFKAKDRIAVAVVSANAQSKPIDASFTMLTASTAMDAVGTIWSVVDDGGTKRVVLESSDDLAAILAARQASRKVFANPIEGRNVTTASFTNGDIVRYVDTASKQTTWGFAFNTVEGVQIVKPDMEAAHVDINAIVATVPRRELDETARKAVEPIYATAKLDADKFSKILTYLKKAYPSGGMATELFSKYSKLAQNAR